MSYADVCCLLFSQHSGQRCYSWYVVSLFRRCMRCNFQGTTWFSLPGGSEKWWRRKSRDRKQSVPPWRRQICDMHIAQFQNDRRSIWKYLKLENFILLLKLVLAGNAHGERARDCWCAKGWNTCRYPRSHSNQHRPGSIKRMRCVSLSKLQCLINLFSTLLQAPHVDPNVKTLHMIQPAVSSGIAGQSKITHFIGLTLDSVWIWSNGAICDMADMETHGDKSVKSLKESQRVSDIRGSQPSRAVFEVILRRFDSNFRFGLSNFRMSLECRQLSLRVSFAICFLLLPLLPLLPWTRLWTKIWPKAIVPAARWWLGG